MKNKKFFFRPAQVAAVGLLPCGGDDPCTACDAVFLANNVFAFLVKLSLGVAILLAVTAGILYITSSGSSQWIAKAKKALFYVLLGFVLAVLAWVVVNVLAKSLGYKGENAQWWDLSDFVCVWKTNVPLGIGGNEIYLDADISGLALRPGETSKTFHLFANENGEAMNMSQQAELLWSSVPGLELKHVRDEQGEAGLQLAAANLNQSGLSNLLSSMGGSSGSTNTGNSSLAGILNILVALGMKSNASSAGQSAGNSQIAGNPLIYFILALMRGTNAINAGNKLDPNGVGGINPGSGTELNSGNNGTNTPINWPGLASGKEAGGDEYTGSGTYNTGRAYISMHYSEYQILYDPNGAESKKCIPLYPPGLTVNDASDPTKLHIVYTHLGDTDLNYQSKAAQLNFSPLDSQHVAVWGSTEPGTIRCPVNRDTMVPVFFRRGLSYPCDPVKNPDGSVTRISGIGGLGKAFICVDGPTAQEDPAFVAAHEIRHVLYGNQDADAFAGGIGAGYTAEPWFDSDSKANMLAAMQDRINRQKGAVTTAQNKQ